MAHKPISSPKTGGHGARPAKRAGSGDKDDRCTIPPSPLDDPHAPGDPGSLAVGYGRPPLHSRFKPGQSGYPKGRSKGSRNMRTIVRQVLNEKMQIREGGRVRRVPALEALVRTTLARCFAGDQKAVASLIAIMRQSGYGPDRDEPTADLLSAADYEAILADYLARNFSADKTDPEIDTSTESSTPDSSTKEQ
jgi:hypothetical protein